MITGTVSMSIGGVGQELTGSYQRTGTSAIIIDESIAGATTDGLVELAFTLAQVKLFMVVASRAMTLETNNSGAPQETITLEADVPMIWDATTDGMTAPFAGNVTALYVTLAAGATATLKIRVLLDATP